LINGLAVSSYRAAKTVIEVVCNGSSSTNISRKRRNFAWRALVRIKLGNPSGRQNAARICPAHLALSDRARSYRFRRTLEKRKTKAPDTKT
jgi:hypothetical protein